MKLRLIFLVLSLLAFLSTAAGGYFYYASLKTAAFQEAERQALTRVEIIQKNLSTFLSENVRPVRTLAGMEVLAAFLAEPDPETGRMVDRILDHFKKSLGVDACYLMDRRGMTVASSNRRRPDSFVGKNFAFRPYFQQALAGHSATYLALGVTSGKRGAYYSFPVYPLAAAGSRPLGVAVIKVTLAQVEKELGSPGEEIVLVADPQGVVFIANRRDWLYHCLWQLPPARKQALAASLQFGRGPWPWLGFVRQGEKYAIDRQGAKFLLHRREIDNYPGWQVIHLRSLDAISRVVSDPLLRVTGPTVLTLCFLIGVSVFSLYRKASGEIIQRKTAEEALRQSEERYRSIYHRTPAMLHSINERGVLVSVSDHWLDALGYRREEVVGRELTAFMTDSSRRYAREQVIPRFFRTGNCKDIPYQFVTKNGEIIEVLLSAIGDRDSSGRIVRSLAVSIDITKRKRAEEQLRRAQEELSRHSRDLEKQVRKRTAEINSILRYTPAVIYIKDREGRYLMVNFRFAELFGIDRAGVVGLTDAEFLPPAVAAQFCRHDQEVMTRGEARQVVEYIPQGDSRRTYLSVKFPVYDDVGEPSGICGIATDITELKKAQDQLRRLSGGIMASQEKERAAIARGLHDELGQVLTALRFEAAWLQGRLAKLDEEAARRALTMSSLIDDAIDEVRGIALRLRPGILDDLGLVDALEWYAADFERRTGISCTCKCGEVPPLGNLLATAAYRIAQEALTNVARHAAAEQVQVELEVRGGFLQLRIVDDGRGFAPGCLREAAGLGVAGMRERAGLVGGSLTVTSRPGAGTRVVFQVLLAGQEWGADDQGIAG